MQEIPDKKKDFVTGSVEARSSLEGRAGVFPAQLEVKG